MCPSGSYCPACFGARVEHARAEMIDLIRYLSTTLRAVPPIFSLDDRGSAMVGKIRSDLSALAIQLEVGEALGRAPGRGPRRG